MRFAASPPLSQGPTYLSNILRSRLFIYSKLLLYSCLRYFFLDNEQSLEKASPCFKFKLNHAILSNQIIEYATLHIYNEADVDSNNGIYKTIHLKEVRGNAFQGGLLQDERVSIKVHKKSGAKFVDSSETGHFILRDREVIQDPVDESRKTSSSKGGQHEKEAKHGTDSTEDNDQASGYADKSKDAGSLDGLVTNDNKFDGRSNDGKKNQKEGGKTGKIYEDLLSSEIHLQTNEWFDVHVREMIQKWTHRYKSKTHTHTLKIECEGCGAKLKICKRPKYRPFLVLKLTEKKQRRKRRSDEDYCATGYDKCCRQRLYINFKDIGWHDWIIEPAGFEVNYCEGRCRGAGIIPARSHVFVKQELAKSHSYLNICCVPVKFSSLTILHFDNHGLIHKTTLKNMTVKKCECV